MDTTKSKESTKNTKINNEKTKTIIKPTKLVKMKEKKTLKKSVQK